MSDLDLAVLRARAEAARVDGVWTSHPPAFVIALLDRLEAAERERDERRAGQRTIEKALAKANLEYGGALERIVPSEEALRSGDLKPTAAWRSRDYLVVEYPVPGLSGIRRLSINRTARAARSWADGIPWDDLQRLKREAGYGHLDAVEVYPADEDLVCVAPMRHLWVLDGPLPFAWRKDRP
mgnify:FL=1